MLKDNSRAMTLGCGSYFLLIIVKKQELQIKRQLKKDLIFHAVVI